jgi:hypothetical protein
MSLIDRAICGGSEQSQPLQRRIPGYLLFGFRRGADGEPVSCELRHCDECGWEVQFFDLSGSLFCRARFSTRVLAVEWAEQQRQALEKQ